MGCRWDGTLHDLIQGGWRFGGFSTGGWSLRWTRVWLQHGHSNKCESVL